MQLDKDLPYAEVGKLVPNKVPDQCWQVISIDMIGELLDSKVYNAALVVVDCLSKQIHTIPTSPPWILLESPSCSWNMSGAIMDFEVISDHGPTFISNFSCNLATLLGVKLTLSTSYHPQTDGQTECVNQEIEVYL